MTMSLKDMLNPLVYKSLFLAAFNGNDGAQLVLFLLFVSIITLAVGIHFNRRQNFEDSKGFLICSAIFFAVYCLYFMLTVI